MIVTDTNAYRINRAQLAWSLRRAARHCETCDIQVTRPRANAFMLELGGRRFQLEIQEFTAQLTDADTRDTILAAISTGENFEDDLALAVINGAIGAAIDIL